MPSLNWLRVFAEAAEAESFARAAIRLNMSAAAVSQQVRALEDHLGHKLFERRAQAVRLTEIGRAYFPVVANALRQVERASEGLFGAEWDDTVFVQSVALFAHGILIPRLPRFEIGARHIQVSLATESVLGQANPRLADMRIVFGDPSHLTDERDHLLKEAIYPVASPAIAADVRDLQDLARLPRIEVLSHRAGWTYFWQAHDVAPAAARILHTENSMLAAAFAAAGSGVMLARAPASDAVVMQTGLVRCLPDLAPLTGIDSFHLTYSSKAHLRRPARRFRTWLLDEMSTIRGPGDA